MSLLALFVMALAGTQSAWSANLMAECTHMARLADMDCCPEGAGDDCITICGDRCTVAALAPHAMTGAEPPVIVRNNVNPAGDSGPEWSTAPPTPPPNSGYRFA